MTSTHSLRLHVRRSLFAFAATSLLAVTATAQVAPAENLNLRETLEACRTGNTYQTRESCIGETRAAHAARERGTLQTNGDYAANALARCNIYRQQEEVLACRARVMGLGQVTGSVSDGGLLRRYEYLVPAQEADTAPTRPQQSMGAAPAGAGTSTHARPPEPVAPLRPILPLSPAFPMFDKGG